MQHKVALALSTRRLRPGEVPTAIAAIAGTKSSSRRTAAASRHSDLEILIMVWLLLQDGV